MVFIISGLVGKLVAVASGGIRVRNFNLWGIDHSFQDNHKLKQPTSAQIKDLCQKHVGFVTP